jgi:hypothetical protein
MENEVKDEGQVTDNTSQDNGSEGAPEATGKTINISGKSFNVSDDVAQAFSELTTDVDRRFQERSEELGGLRQFKNDVLRREQEMTTASHKQERPDLGTLMYENPEGFVDEIKKEIKAETNNLRTEYQQAEAAKKDEENFWNGMWSENPDLAIVKAQATDVIKMIGQKYSHLNLQNTKQVRDALAQQTRDWMKEIMSGNIKNSQDGFAEGSSTYTTPAKAKKEDKPRRTTRQIQEETRAKRRQAMANRT